MDLMEQVKKDTEYFSQMLEQLDKEGSFNDTLPNSGTEYSEETELSDLLRYQKYIQQPGSLSFLSGT